MKFSKCIIFFAFLFLIFCSARSYSQKIPVKDSVQIFELLTKSGELVRTDSVKSLQNILQALKLSQKLQYERGVAYAYDRYGMYYGIHNDYKKAIAYFQKSIAISKKIKDEKREASSLINLALKYIGTGDFNNAFKTGDEALKITTKIKDSLGIARSYGLISDSYYLIGRNSNDRVGNSKKSIIYLEKAIDINRKMKDSVSLVHTIVLGAIKYMESGRAQTALTLLNEAKVVAIKSKQDYLSQVESQIGTAYYFLEDWPRAIAANKEALNGFRKSGNIHAQFMALVNIGEIYLKTKKYKEAGPFYTEALQVSKKIQGYDHYQAVHSNLAEMYIGLNDYKKAYYHKEQAIAYHDSILDGQKMKTAKEMEVKFETRLVADKNKLLKKENALQKLEAERKNFILYAAIAIVLFLLIGIAFLYNFYKQRNIINANKNNELKQKLLLTQMNPHFIFNSVDNIQSLIHNKQDKEAINYLTKFSKLTRQILENSRENFILLSEELNILDNYLTIQKLLYNNNFKYEIEVGDNIDPEELLVPPMLTQPFIENAIKHGLRNTTEGGLVRIRYYIKDRQLYFEVVDNGSGIDNNSHLSDKNHKSLSTQITRERLYSINQNKDIAIHISNITGENDIIEGVKTFFEIPYILNN